MRNTHPLESTDSLPTSGAKFQSELHVVLVYENFEMGVEGKRIFDLIAKEAGGPDNAQLTVWRFDFFHSAELVHALSRQAEEADVIIVAPRDANQLPPQVKHWLESWPTHRRIEGGAVVAIFKPDEGIDARTSDAALLLWRAAERAGMNFFCRAADPKASVKRQVRTTPVTALLVSDHPAPAHERQWGVNE